MGMLGTEPRPLKKQEILLTVELSISIQGFVILMLTLFPLQKVLKFYLRKRL